MDNLQSSGEGDKALAALSTDGQRRRSVLLSGLVRSGALLTAGMSTRATANITSIPAGKSCTVSGFHSAVMSQNATPGLCGAFAPSHFVTDASGSVAARNWDTLEHLADQATLKVGALLGGASSNRVLDALYDSTTEGFFVAAFFSAHASVSPPSGTVHVPFDQSYVVSQFNGGSPTPDAITFFQTLCVFG